MSKIDDIIDFFNKMKMEKIDDKAEEIKTNVENIKGIELNRVYSKIISAENDIEQSYLDTENHGRQSYVQSIAQCKLNEGIAILQQDFVNIIEYFVNWDNTSVISKSFGSRKYNEDNIIKNINQLCDDYVYLKKGIMLLIKLKKFQGIDKCVDEEKDRLKALEDMIYMNEIYNWLPPETEENSWQHQLLYGEKYENLSTENTNLKTKAKNFIKSLAKKGKNEYDLQK